MDDNKDPDSMDNSKEGTNQNKLDEMENWRMTNNGIEIKGNTGFVPISTMSKELLQACLNLKRFADVRQYIEAEIKKK